MSQPPEVTTTDLPPQDAAEPRGDGWGLVQVAPGPEAPDTRDKGARQKGMIIALVGGAAFWAAVAGVVVLVRAAN
ncbi:hypothetical protein [Phenylobacterium sp.]|uniref:hypothetical protein n=1 Tax=Phenylobacterium sp. TaxID=1871053 RepID=UPI002BB50FD4|nr:hypothetical protein [Phenylobacterium sp.]HVI33850.1 hypothetical protein [Phenylobacterium sp.]